MIRKNQHARSQCRKRALESHVPQECVICGYSKHVQVCHLKPVASFPEGTPSDRINATKNLTFLCPNHHYELDHGLLSFVPPSIAEMEKVPPPARVRVIKERPGPAFLNHKNKPLFMNRLRLK